MTVDASWPNFPFFSSSPKESLGPCSPGRKSCWLPRKQAPVLPCTLGTNLLEQQQKKAASGFNGSPALGNY